MNDDIAPEIPAAYANRRTAISAESAALFPDHQPLGTDENGNPITRKAGTLSPNAQRAKDLAMEYAGFDPLQGLTEEKIKVARAKKYTNGPRPTIQLGDLTREFVNYVWATDPRNAAIRYGARINAGDERWPTVLPANWPPVSPVDPMKAGEDRAEWLERWEARRGQDCRYLAEAIGAHSSGTDEERLPAAVRVQKAIAAEEPTPFGRSYTQQEVDAMLASAQKPAKRARTPAQLANDAKLGAARKAKAEGQP
jgi:hypothetical protein